MSYSVAEVYWRFVWTYRLHLQSWRIAQQVSSSHSKYPAYFLGLLFHPEVRRRTILQTSTKLHGALFQKMPLFPCPVYVHWAATAHWKCQWHFSTRAVKKLNTVWSGIHMGEPKKTKRYRSHDNSFPARHSIEAAPHMHVASNTDTITTTKIIAKSVILCVKIDMK
jgi:hypothetical protein